MSLKCISRSSPFPKFGLSEMGLALLPSGDLPLCVYW